MVLLNKLKLMKGIVNGFFPIYQWLERIGTLEVAKKVMV
jgi:hypothetical protein